MIDSGATAMTIALSPRSSVPCHRRCKQDLRLRIWHTTHGSRSERCGSVQIGSRKQNVERLRWEFGEHTFKLGKTMEDFSIRLNNVIGDLRVLSDVVSDKEVIKHMLHAVPERLEQVAISMETLLDLDSLSIEEAVGHLHAVEQCKKPSPAKETNGRLLLTKEEWLARMKTHDGSGSDASARTSIGNKSSGKGKAGKGGAGEKKSTVGRDDTCGYYGKKGHWARECRKKKRDEEAQAHITVGDEEEQSLLLAHDITINLPSSPALVAAEFKHRPIHIYEQRVYADLSSVEGHHHDRWVIDTGAMNHMTSSQGVFSELNTHVTGIVKFGDGSVTKIEGKGSILLTCKNGAHRLLTGVYFIPRM
jgi:hypothetical protein